MANESHPPTDPSVVEGIKGDLGETVFKEGVPGTAVPESPVGEVVRGEKGIKGDTGDTGKTGRRGAPGADAPSDDELLEELRKVGSSLAFRQQVRRLLKIIGAVALVALVASVLAVSAYLKVRDYQQVACDRDNALRKAYTDQWVPVLAESAPPTKPPEGSPQEVIDAYEAQIETRRVFEEGLNKGFAQHPC